MTNCPTSIGVYPSSGPHNSTTCPVKSFRCSSYVEINACTHDWCCSYGDSSVQIVTSYTTCSNGARWGISLIHAVKPTADITANVTAVAKTPKTYFRTHILPSRSVGRPTQNSSCDGERKAVWRRPRRRMLQGEQIICCNHTTLG